MPIDHESQVKGSGPNVTVSGELIRLGRVISVALVELFDALGGRVVGDLHGTSKASSVAEPEPSGKPKRPNYRPIRHVGRMERKLRSIACNGRAATDENQKDWTNDVRYTNCEACRKELARRAATPIRHWQREVGKMGEKRIACTGQDAMLLPSWEQHHVREKATCPACRAFDVEKKAPAGTQPKRSHRKHVTPGLIPL